MSRPWGDPSAQLDAGMAIFQRSSETRREPIAFVLDGARLTALRGDTVLIAVLTQAERLRRSEFSGSPRAGFCLIGACQDCWMQAEDGRRLRACTTPVENGMRLCSERPQGRS